MIPLGLGIISFIISGFVAVTHWCYLPNNVDWPSCSGGLEDVLTDNVRRGSPTKRNMLNILKTNLSKQTTVVCSMIFIRKVYVSEKLNVNVLLLVYIWNTKFNLIVYDHNYQIKYFVFRKFFLKCCLVLFIFCCLLFSWGIDSRERS